VIGDRNRGEFEQLGQHDVLVQHEAWDLEKHRHAQEWLKEQKASLEREIGRQQVAVARDAARSASYAASDAAAEVRSYARTAKAALIIATIALLVSIITLGACPSNRIFLDEGQAS
jgi:hypothetical protein